MEKQGYVYILMEKGIYMVTQLIQDVICQIINWRKVMYTELGEIKIFINGKEVPYKTIELINYSQYFSVRNRFKLSCDVPKQIVGDINIECIIEIKKDIKVTSYSETGENLALISFYWDKNKLSLGTRGDIEGVKYSYLDNAIKLTMQRNPRQVMFYVAWLELVDSEEEDIYTWFAADPAYEC